MSFLLVAIISIVLSIVVILWYFLGRERIGHDYVNPLLKKHSFTPLRIKILWILRIAIFSLLALLYTTPHITKLIWIEEKNGKSIIIVLDISKSMKTDDITPSRLDKAIKVIDTFLQGQNSDQIGLILFAGRSFVMSPLSEDREGIRSILKNTTTDTIDQSQPDTSGTNIGDALLSGMVSLEKSMIGEKIIILVTDGRANAGISPLIVAEQAEKRNIIIYPIAI
jgi:Ca-activated chloride channel homolog